MNCSSLEKIIVSPDQPSLAVIDNALYSKPDKRLVYVPMNVTSFSIPQGIASIGEAAFYDCKRLTSVTIPDSVTSIGYRAFDDCDSSLTLTVGRGSYAAEYAKANGLSYTYPDALDWLNN